MKKSTWAILIAVVLAGAALVYYGYSSEVDDSWTWELTNEGCNTEINNITFTDEMFTVAGGSDPLIVLSSVYPCCSGDIFVFQVQPGEGLTSWSSHRYELGIPNELTNILADVPCNICVENSCTLIIEG